MISTSVKLTGSIPGFLDPKVNVNSDGFLTLGQERMQDIGEFAIRTVRARVAKGVGSDDSPMPALKVSNRAGSRFKIHGVERSLSSYPQWKSAHGLQPIRDLRGDGKQGGNMLENLSVRTVSGSSVTMAITARMARVKALANEQRTPWLSFSDNDQAAILKYAAQMFHAQIETIAQKRRTA